RPSAKDISSKLLKWRMIVMNPSLAREESNILRSFISADDEIKTKEITLQNYQSSKYTSKLINTKEIKLAYESTKYESIKFRVYEICAI
ncbi:11715_t:CDS:2, partial [Racocetra persica]